jgi:predicted DNA-binding transcriptional regulator AlpA
MKQSTPKTRFDSKELAARWCMSHRTLDRWRWQGKGPRFVKIGGKVVYRLEDIESYEETNLRANTVYIS